MKRLKLQDQTLEQLVDRFITIALDQDKALRRRAHAKFNRLFDEMEAIKLELKARTGDQRRVLVALFIHPNAQVRLKSAIATLAVAPEAARRTLQIISDRNEYPQAADARGMMMAVDAGTFIPT